MCITDTRKPGGGGTAPVPTGGHRDVDRAVEGGGTEHHSTCHDTLGAVPYQTCLEVCTTELGYCNVVSIVTRVIAILFLCDMLLNRTFAKDVTCRQGALTLLDTWFLRGKGFATDSRLSNGHKLCPSLSRHISVLKRSRLHKFFAFGR